MSGTQPRSLADLKDALSARQATEAAAIASGQIAPSDRPKAEPKRDALGRSYATGRRKESTARVWLKPGKGDISVNGKPITESRHVDIHMLAGCFHYFSGWATKLTGETTTVNPSFFTYTLREPIGVIGAIIPWNFPMIMVGWKAAPALAARRAGSGLIHHHVRVNLQR